MNFKLCSVHVALYLTLVNMCKLSLNSAEHLIKSFPRGKLAALFTYARNMLYLYLLTDTSPMIEIRSNSYEETFVLG